MKEEKNYVEKNVEGEITMKKYYFIEENENEILRNENIEKMKMNFIRILEDNSNYNYQMNKDNNYILYEVLVEDEEDPDKDIYDIIYEMKVNNFKDMSYEEKEKYFN